MRKGEARARFMTELYRQYARLMYGTAWEQLRSADHLDDVVDEAVLRLCRHEDTLRRLSERARAAYIYETTRSAAVDYLKKESRQRGRAVSAEVPEDWPDDRLEPLEWLLQKERERCVRQCWSRLEEREKQVLKLRFFDDASAAEIAERYRVTPATARNWVRGALEKLRRMMEAMDDEK